MNHIYSNNQTYQVSNVVWNPLWDEINQRERQYEEEQKRYQIEMPTEDSRPAQPQQKMPDDDSKRGIEIIEL